MIYIYIFVNLGITYTNLLPIRRFLCPLSTGDFVIFFFLSGFSFKDTNSSQDRRGREKTIFYFTLPPTNIQTFLSNFACEVISHILIAPLVFTWCYMRFTTLSNYRLTDLGRDVILCLFIWWFDSRFLLQQFDAGNRWIWTSIDNHPLYYKQTDWPSVLVTPRKDLYKSFQNVFSFSCILRGLLV